MVMTQAIPSTEAVTRTTTAETAKDLLGADAFASQDLYGGDGNDLLFAYVAGIVATGAGTNADPFVFVSSANFDIFNRMFGGEGTETAAYVFGGIYYRDGGAGKRWRMVLKRSVQLRHLNCLLCGGALWRRR